MSEAIKLKRLIVDGNVAIKPYLYIRNSKLHVRYTCDKCVELTEAEEKTVFARLTEHPEKKQEILSELWSVTSLTERPIYDGIHTADKIMNEKRRSNGQ